VSRLEAIAAELGISRDGARTFTGAVRQRFDAAPSYAIILSAIRRCKAQTPRPSAAQVAAMIQQMSKDADERRATEGRRPRPRQEDERPGRRGRRQR
jgi:hypothetical protein